MNELEHFSTRLPGGFKKELKVEAAKNGKTVQELVTELFQRWIDEKEAAKKGE